jgi:hypothetical protein
MSSPVGADETRVSVLARHLLPAAIISLAVVAMAGFFVFARPEYRAPNQGETIKVPPEHPANGWTWSVGTPGWKPGTMLGKHHDFNVSGVQPVEVEAAQLSAAHSLLDADGMRVVDSIRVDRDGPLAILAAPVLDTTPAHTCLAAMVQGDAPVTWLCSPQLARIRVLVAAKAAAGFIDFVGVARGDVSRVVLKAPGFQPMTRYAHGDNWGQFQAAVTPKPGAAPRLLVYGAHGLVETITLALRPGEQRVYS